MSTQPELGSAEINVKVQIGALQRAGAAKELADLGINASPADVEQYLNMSRQERQHANMTWLILNASYT